jgi:hypothetical protein
MVFLAQMISHTLHRFPSVFLSFCVLGFMLRGTLGAGGVSRELLANHLDLQFIDALTYAVKA